MSSCFVPRYSRYYIIRENTEIKDIDVYEKDVKLSQYADDTTIFF